MLRRLYQFYNKYGFNCYFESLMASSTINNLFLNPFVEAAQ
jgi:hypothetical protein